MATEKRLIDANALVDAIEDIDWYHVNAKGRLVDGANPANNTPIYKAFDIYNAIKNAPTVDAVPMEQYNELKERYKRLLETADILDAALREYQQKYGELEDEP